MADTVNFDVGGPDVDRFTDGPNGASRSREAGTRESEAAISDFTTKGSVAEKPPDLPSEDKGVRPEELSLEELEALVAEKRRRRELLAELADDLPEPPALVNEVPPVVTADHQCVGAYPKEGTHDRIDRETNEFIYSVPCAVCGVYCTVRIKCTHQRQILGGDGRPQCAKCGYAVAGRGRLVYDPRIVDGSGKPYVPEGAFTPVR
jgi:hypothetical protein